MSDKAKERKMLIDRKYQTYKDFTIKPKVVNKGFKVFQTVFFNYL